MKSLQSPVGGGDPRRRRAASRNSIYCSTAQSFGVRLALAAEREADGWTAYGIVRKQPSLGPHERDVETVLRCADLQRGRSIFNAGDDPGSAAPASLAQRTLSYPGTFIVTIVPRLKSHD